MDFFDALKAYLAGDRQAALPYIRGIEDKHTFGLERWVLYKKSVRPDTPKVVDILRQVEKVGGCIRIESEGWELVMYIPEAHRHLRRLAEQRYKGLRAHLLRASDSADSTSRKEASGNRLRRTPAAISEDT